MKALHYLTFALLIIGGLNWAVLALTGWEVGQIFDGGQEATASKIIYVLVGLSAVFEVATHAKNCRTCSPSAVTV